MGSNKCYAQMLVPRDTPLALRLAQWLRSLFSSHVIVSELFAQ